MVEGRQRRARAIDVEKNHTHTHTHTRKYTNTHTHTNTQTHTHKHTHPHPSGVSPDRANCGCCLETWLLVLGLHPSCVPPGSPSRGGDVTVSVPDINQPSLPPPFYSLLVSVSVFITLSIVFHSINSPPKLPAFSLCSFGLISALLVFSTIYLFLKLFLSPDVILCGWLGLKHQLTN